MKCSQNENIVNTMWFFWEVISNGRVLEKIQKDNQIWKCHSISYKNKKEKKKLSVLLKVKVTFALFSHSFYKNKYSKF